MFGRSPAGKICPLLKKACVEHQCAWYTRLYGTDPQNGNPIDHYECAITIGPALQVEVAKEVRQGAAATESFRNEMVDANRTTLPVLAAIASRS